MSKTIMGRKPQDPFIEAPWIVEVRYPFELAPDHDDLVDVKTGQHEDIRQCWGYDHPDSSEPCRRLRYAFWSLPKAMAAAERVATLPRILSIDVFDEKYPQG